MPSTGRIFVGLFLLALNVGCFERDAGPCGGCASPHPYTQTSGGTTTSVTGSADVHYDAGSATMRCNGDVECAWNGAVIEIEAKVPSRWAVADAGTDADAEPDAGADADANADADADAGAEGVLGSPRGWDGTGVVVFVLLGDTPLDRSGPLEGARIVTCGDRFEALVSDADAGAYACASAGLRPARSDALEGTLDVSRPSGEYGTTTLTLTGKSASGARVSFVSTTTSSPYESHVSQDCY